MWAGGYTAPKSMQWNNPQNWILVNDISGAEIANPASAYPGAGATTGANVIIPAAGANHQIVVSEVLNLGVLDIRTPATINFNSNSLTVVDIIVNFNDISQFAFTNTTVTVTGTLELYNVLQLITATITTKNLKIGQNTGSNPNRAGVSGGTLTMGGATVVTNPNSPGNGVTISPVTSDIGNIDTGNRNVIITVDPNAPDINIGDINSNGNVTVNAGTGNNNVTINDIDAGGTITVNVPGGTVTVPPGIPGIDYNNPGIIADSGAPSGDPSAYNGQHLVYGLHNPFPGNSAYFFINSNDYVLTALPPNPSTPVANREIYIVDVGYTQTQNLTINNANGSFTEFRGSYNSSNSLTITNPGSTGVRLNNATITLTGAGNSFSSGPMEAVDIPNATSSAAVQIQATNGPVVLIGNGAVNNSITAANIYIGHITGNNNHLSLTGSAYIRAGVQCGTGNTTTIPNFPVAGSTDLGNLLITGDVRFINRSGYPSSGVNAASITVTQTAYIYNHLITTGDQNYGSVVFGATTATGYRYLNGQTVTMGQINGSNIEFTITGNAVFNGASNTNIRNLTVTGTSRINGNITTGTVAASGAQNYNGPVILGTNNVTLTKLLAGTTATSQITFGSTITSESTARSLTISTNATTVFNGAVSNISELAVNGNGPVTIGANITTTGNQTYTGNVILSAAANLTADTGSLIGFGGTLNSQNATARALTITNANVTFGGNVGTTQPLASINVIGTPTVGTTTISGNITTNAMAGQRYNGNVILGINTTLNAGAANPVVIGSATGRLSGAHNLTITGAATLNGTSSRIDALTLNQTGIFQTADLQAALVSVAQTSNIGVNINTTSNQTYTGAVTLSNNINLECTTAARDILFGSTVNGAFSLTVTNATATFNGAVGGTIALTTIHIIGDSVINANITTSGYALIHGENNTTQMYRQSVVLGANVTLTGPQDRNIRIDGTTNGAFALTVNTANVTFDNSVGNNTPLASLTVTGGNATIMGPAAQIQTTGNQSYGSNLTIRATQPHTLGSASGSFTVTGVISTPNDANIIIQASQGITMNNAANTVSGEVTLFNFNGTAAGNIVFRNNSTTHTVITLSNIFSNGNINITSVTGSILLNGVYSGNIVTIVSAADITLNATVSSTNRLVLEAAGTVLIPSSVSVGTNSNGITCITDASIYINAAALNIPGTVGDIVPGASGRLCVCQIPINAVTINNTRIPADRICTHYKPLVFGRNIPAEYLPPNNYRVVDIDTDTIENAYQVDGGNYIVLVNVGTIPNNITFTVGNGTPAGAGHIEIRGVYSPTGNITLLPGSGGIHLNGANITVTNNFSMIVGGNTRSLHLVGTAGAISSSITAPDIFLIDVMGANTNNNLTLTSTAGNVSFNASIAAGPINNLTVNATGGSIVFMNSINGIYTNGNQEYNGNVRLDVPVTFSGPAVTPITRNIRFGNTVGNNGGGVPTLNVTNLNAVFDNTVSNIDNLIINSSGTTTINANITTVSAQIYSGNVILGGAGSRTLTAGSTVQAEGILSGNSGITVVTSGDIVMQNAGNTISGNINLSIPQTGVPPRTINFYTLNNITLNAVNNTTNGNVRIFRAGTLGIASLQAPNGNVVLGEAPAIRVGTVTQTAPISVQSLTIHSSAGITLNNPANAVSSLFIGGANADVEFVNVAPNLSIAGIESVINSDVTIKNSANISVVGVDTLVGGILTLESVSGAANAINIGESIWANRLILKANPINGVITVQGSVTINVSSNNDHDSGPGDGTEASIYVNAFSFVALSGTNGNIHPGTSGEICIDADNFTHNGRIAGNRYCFHGGVPTGMHLVYGYNASGDFTGNPVYFMVDGSRHPTVPYRVSDNFNIYIIDADVTWDNLAFVTGGTGYIEFRRDNSLMGDNLVLTPGSGGIRFNNSSLTVKEAFNRNIVLIGQSAGTSNSITAQSVNLANITRVGTEASDLALSAAVNGNIVLGNIAAGIIKDLNANVSGTGSVTIGNNITTTGEQNYNGPVTITSNRTLTGTRISLDAISGAGFTLTVNGLGSNNGVAVINGIANVASLIINGDTVLIDAVINTTAAGINQNYQGNVIITGDVALAGNGSSIRFHENIDGTNGEVSNLTISNMNNINIDGAAGNNVPLTSIMLGTFLPSSPVGTITVPQEIITESLSINSTAAVNLPNSNNEIAKIAVTSAGNSINIVNKGALEVAGINGANASTVSIKTTGDITQTGLITGNVILQLDSQGKIDLSHEDGLNSNAVYELHILEAGGDVAFANNSSVSLNHVSITNAQNYALSFKSMNGDIIVSANIECERLALEAQNGEVAINYNITVHHSHDCNDVPPGEHAAMYVVANTFSGNGTIHLMDTQKTGEVCVWARHPNYNGIVRDCDGVDTVDNRIHHHMYAGRNIIYRYGPVSDPFPANVDPYDHNIDIYIQADNFTGTIVQARAGNTGSVYIIDIYDNASFPQVNSRYVNFLSDTSGSIQIFGEYYSSNVLGLHPGVGGIHLWDIDRGGAAINANVMLTGTNSIFDSRGPVTLRGAIGETYTINAGTISVGEISSDNDDPRSLALNGNAVLEGSVSGLENFSVSGTTIVDSTLNASVTLQAQSISLASTLNVINANVITIDVSDEYAQGGDIVSGASFIQTGSGIVTFQANADSIQITANGAAVHFASEVAINSDLAIAMPASAGIVEFASGMNVNPHTLILSGGSNTHPVEMSMDTGNLGNVKILTGSHVSLSPDKTIRQRNASTLEMEAANTVLDTTAGSWHIGDAVTSPLPSRSFEGSNGQLILGTDARLICADFNLTGSDFSVNNTGKAEIAVHGNVFMESGVNFNLANLPYLVLDMAGTGTQHLSADAGIGSLYVQAGSVTVLQNDLSISGAVYINHVSMTSGVLNAGNFNVTVSAGLNGTKDGAAAKIGSWRINGGTIAAGGNPVNVMNAFQQASDKSVTFVKYNSSDTNVYFEIIGNTVWQNFVCNENGGVTFQFSTHPHQHVFLETFDVKGTGSNNRIRLTRLPAVYDAGGNIENGNPDWVYYYSNALHGDPPVVSGQFNEFGIPVIPDDPNLKNNDLENIKFWNFSLFNLAGLQIDFVEIYFSHAWNEPIIVETNVSFIPYYEGNHGFFNHNWREDKTFKIIYSFIEDRNGDGRADRIRVQTSVNVHGDIVSGGFSVHVDGYEVESYALAQDVTNNMSDNDSFFIILKEEPHHRLYDGTPITWRITNNVMPNGSPILYDGRGRTIGRNDGTVFTTFNTIPPRISFTLTLPDRDGTFIQMSQPVAPWSSSVSAGGSAGTINGNLAMADRLDSANRPHDSLVHHIDPENPVTLQLKPDQPEMQGAFSFIIESDGTVNTVGNLASESNTFTMQGLWSLAERAIDWSAIDSNFPPPKYPVDWNYTGYLAYTGNEHLAGSPSSPVPVTNMFVPPFRVLTNQMIIDLHEGNYVTPSSFNGGNDLITRRATDVLVSIPPVASDSTDYFAWPIWARFNPAEVNIPGLNVAPGSGFWGQMIADTGIIWEFDGTKYLEAQNTVELQARINPLLSGTLNLIHASNVGAGFRNPMRAAERGRGTGGLWIPSIVSPLYYHYAPLSAQPNQISGTNPAPGLFNYYFDNTASGEKIEFVFRIDNSDMIAARLDIPRGSAIPDNWYRLVRPFSFDIQDITRARGGVTILNNVINSDAREITYLRYNLVRPGRVTIQVHTLDGTLVKSIRRNDHREAGEWTDGWDGTNNGGRPVARGMYFIRVVGPDIDEIRKVMVIR